MVWFSIEIVTVTPGAFTGSRCTSARVARSRATSALRNARLSLIILLRVAGRTSSDHATHVIKGGTRRRSAQSSDESAFVSAKPVCLTL